MRYGNCQCALAAVILRDMDIRVNHAVKFPSIIQGKRMQYETFGFEPVHISLFENLNRYMQMDKV